MKHTCFTRLVATSLLAFHATLSNLTAAPDEMASSLEALELLANKMSPESPVEERRTLSLRVLSIGSSLADSSLAPALANALAAGELNPDTERIYRGFWTQRAIAAVRAEDEEAGRQAGMVLRRIGGLDPAQEDLFEVFAVLRSFDWVSPEPSEATRGSPFVNTLGMEFIPLPGKPGVLMCRTETRVRDFRAFARSTDHVQPRGVWCCKVNDTNTAVSYKLDASATWEQPGFEQSVDHPVAGVSWHEAKYFSSWLSKREGRNYRLPKDEEWSSAVGDEQYPWGIDWPPPPGAGNYFGKEASDSFPPVKCKAAYDYSDGYPRTAPVGALRKNRTGFFDMGGNVSEWCEDSYQTSMNSAETIAQDPSLRTEIASDGTQCRILRGASWKTWSQGPMMASFRDRDHPGHRSDEIGFRCVLIASGG